MRCFRRPIALLVGLILLHFVAVDSAFACADPPATGVGTAMAGMDMSSATAPPSCDTTPCDAVPTAPQGCDVMAACASAALATAPRLDAPPWRVLTRIATPDALAPPSRTPAPEPPPPRA